jgi:hypothetical protein
MELRRRMTWPGDSFLGTAVPFWSTTLALWSLRNSGGLFGGDFNLSDDVFALVVELVFLCSNGRVVGGEIEIDVDGIRGLINDMAGRKNDVDRVVPLTWMADLNGVGAGLVFQDVGHDPRQAAKDPGGDGEA